METNAKSNRAGLFIGGVLLAWILYLAFFGLRAGSGGALGAPDLAGGPHGQAVYDWRIQDLAGKEVGFDSFQGKTVFLNRWATWCPPCVAELPAIAKLARSSRLKNVVFVLISDEPAETIQAFARRKSLDLPFYHVDARELPSVFDSEGIPATFLIAPDGRVAVRQIGSAQWDDPSVIDYLEGLSRTSVAAAE